MHISKHVLKKLPKIEDPETSVYMDYVQGVLGGTPKGEVLKEVFPEEYEKAIERAGGNPKVIGANIKKAINGIERRKAVKEMFTIAQKHAWVTFLEKKNKLYENLYTMALNEDNLVRDRINSSKVMLEHMPSFQEDINVRVEVKQSKEDFVTNLRNMQLQLFRLANNKEDLDAMEAEIIEEGKSNEANKRLGDVVPNKQEQEYIQENINE